MIMEKLSIKEFESLSTEEQTELFTSNQLPEDVLNYLYSFNEEELLSKWYEDTEDSFDIDFYDSDFDDELLSELNIELDEASYLDESEYDDYSYDCL